MKYYVYILYSEKTRLTYTGCTTNLAKRLEAHNKGSNQSTKHQRPFKLMWYSSFESKEKAFAFEKYLKSGSGHAFMKRHLI